LDGDQSRADADQISSDADQKASDLDQAASEGDQESSDADQETADREEAASTDQRSHRDYQVTREERARASWQRRTTSVDRMGTTAERARIARDRGRASSDRAQLEAELLVVHRDDLTGAYRRNSGRLALANEIDRARRADGRFVVAFVDVDDLKGINDRLGHAAGDEALMSVVKATRQHLRSFDPIVRYGGDEFVAGIGGADIDEVGRRFGVIQSTLRQAADIGISVGLAELRDDDTVDALMARADEALYSRRRNSGRSDARLGETAPPGETAQFGEDAPRSR
jgi:diguanylate cyclase (GGDEF)-like protein